MEMLSHSTRRALARYEALLCSQPAVAFLSPTNTLPVIDERFFHLKEISRTNLASLVEGELSVPGEWAHQFVEEEELDMTLQQMLADANGESRLSLVVSEEGQGKTALLRYILNNLASILAAGNPNTIDSSYMKSFSHRSPSFAVYVKAPLLVNGFVQRKAKGSENPDQALEVLIEAAVKSLPVNASRLFDPGSTDAESGRELESLLSTLLKDSGLPFALLLDAVDPLHPFVANSLLESFLYGTKQQKRKDELPLTSFDDSSVIPLYDFGRHLQQATNQRLNRLVAVCRASTLTAITMYDVEEKMKLKREYLNKKQGGNKQHSPLPALFDPNSYEDFENQWRVFRLEPLKGDVEEDQFLRSLLGHWGLGTGEDARSRILLGLLNERKQTILAPNKRSALSLFLLARDVTRAVFEGEAKRKREGKELFLGEDGFQGVSNSQYEVMDNLVRDTVKYSLGFSIEDGKEGDPKVLRDKRLLLSLFAFLIFWWDENTPHSSAEATKTAKEKKFVGGQKEFVNELMKKFYGGEKERDYYAEALELLPGILLCDWVPSEQRAVFKHSPFHQFLVGEFIAVWYYIANGKTRQVSKSIEGGENLPSIEEMKSFSEALSERRIDRHRIKSLWKEKPKMSLVKEILPPGMVEGEGVFVASSLPLMAWEEDSFAASPWWAEALMFLSFNIAFNEIEEKTTTPTTPATPTTQPDDKFETGSAINWLFNRLVGQHVGDTLGNWLAKLQKYGTDPQDLGQIRFSHLLRAKACEGLVMDIKRQPKPPVKKTEIGRTLLDMMDDSEMAMLHLEDYPVYLQVPYCIGRKGCIDILDRCVVMMETSNFIYASEIILRLGLGGCLGEFDGNETREVKEAALTTRLVRLLKDQEPRTRKAVVSILWKICIQTFSPFFKFGQTKRSNKSQIWVEEKEKTTKKPGEEEPHQQQQQHQQGGAKNIARNLLGLKRIPSTKNDIKTGTGAEIVNRIVATLKDGHTSVQEDAIEAMKQLADISVFLLTANQQSFFLNELLPIVEDAGDISSGGGPTEWRHLVNSAISVMKMFDLYEWLMRWLSHDQPGMRLLVFTALGLLGYPLVETKQKFDPMRKACSLTLAQLSEGYSPTSPPAFADFVKSITERAKLLKGGANGGNLTPPATKTPATSGKPEEEDDGDEDSYLMLPFRVIIYHSFGEAAARCPDLDWMMNLLKCKAAFLHRMSFVVLKHCLTQSGEENAKQKLSNLLTYDAGGGSADKEKVVGGVPVGELNSNMRSEAVRLLSQMGNEKELERIALEFMENNDHTRQLQDDFAINSAITFAAVKYETISSWLRKEVEREQLRRNSNNTTTTSSASPAVTGRQRSFSAEDLQNRTLKLEIIGAFPSFGFRSAHFGFAFLSSKARNLRKFVTSEKEDSGLLGISRYYWNYLLLLLDILDVENEDFVVEETAATKLQEISKNVVRIAFSPLHEQNDDEEEERHEGNESSSNEKDKEKENEKEESESAFDEEKENTMRAMDAKCFKLLNHRNASVVLSTLRLLSSLLVLRSFRDDGEGKHQKQEGEREGERESEGTEGSSVLSEGGKDWKEDRQKNIVAQAMALLTHREAGIRNEAINLLSIFISRKKKYHQRVTKKGGREDEKREEGLGGKLDMEEHLVVLCSMMKTHIYFVRATAITVLGIFIKYFIDIYQLEKNTSSLDELKKLEDSVIKVLQVAQKDSDGIAMESALRVLAFFGEYISEDALKVLLGLLDHPSRLRIAVVETLGSLGSRALSVVPSMIQLLKAEDDNWLRTVATTQLTNLLKTQPLDSETIQTHLNSLGKLLQEDEYYVKEACLQLLSALGPVALRHCSDQILAILDDEDEEEETCVTEIALFGMGQLLAYEKEHIPQGQRKSELYLAHIMPKLEDTAVSVKKTALKAMRKDSSLVAANEAVLARLTKLLNTFAEETTVQIQAFILIGDAGKLSVFNHLSPLLSLLHSKDTKVLMKTVNALALLGAKSVTLLPCAINRTKSHEMRRRLLSLLIKYQAGYDACYCIDTETGSEDGDNVKQQRREVAFLFKHRDATLRRFAFKTIGTYYEIRAGTQDAEDESDSSEGEEEEEEDEEEDVVVFASDYWKKYRKAIMLMLKDQSSRKSRMEAVLALARISNPGHAKMVLRRLFPPVCKKPLIRSVAVWRLLSLQWRTLLDTP